MQLLQIPVKGHQLSLNHLICGQIQYNWFNIGVEPPIVNWFFHNSLDNRTPGTLSCSSFNVFLKYLPKGRGSIDIGGQDIGEAAANIWHHHRRQPQFMSMSPNSIESFEYLNQSQFIRFSHQKLYLFYRLLGGKLFLGNERTQKLASMIIWKYLVFAGVSFDCIKQTFEEHFTKKSQ